MVDRSSAKTAYDEWDPSNLGSLHRKANAGQPILSADVVLVIEQNPHLVSDDRLRNLIISGLKGELAARPGRKPAPPYYYRNFQILDFYEKLLPYLQVRADRRRARGEKKPRADYAPAELACNLIGVRFEMAPESVRNIVSSLQRRGF